METKKIVMGVISVAVAIIVLMSMIPIFTDAGASEDTFTNEGYFYVDSVPEGGSITYLYQNSKLYINGEEMSVPFDSTYNGLTIMYTEDLNIRYDGTVKMRGSLGNHNATYLNITVSDGTITGEWLSSGDIPASISSTYQTFYGIVDDVTGRTMCKMPQYVKPDSFISASGVSNITTGVWAVVNINGSVEDGLTISLHKDNNGQVWDTYTVKNYTISYDEVPGYIDLYKLNQINIVVTDGETDYNLTYTIFTVPSEVTAERSAHASPVESTLIGLIPLLMMVGIMLTAVGLFIAKYRKN